MEEEEEDRYRCFQPQTPHFFKIILHETLQNRKLEIPKSFVQKYGRNLCLNKVYLKVTSGDVWEMELHKEEDGCMWLNNGWQEFVEFYDLKFGHFVVFGYLGNSEFQVLIFDKTSSEIKYPYKCSTNNENYADVNPCLHLLPALPEVEEVDVEMVVDHNACNLNASNCMFLNNCSENTNHFRKGFGDDDHANGDLGTSERFHPKKSKETLEEAVIKSGSFHSANPHFQITMQSHHLNYNFVVDLPAKFIRDHIGENECYLKLFITSERSWTVNCRFRMRANKPTAKIHMGWKPFAMDNNLDVGDVCVFELIDSVKVHFLLTIFRAAKEPSSSHYPVKSKLREHTGRRICRELLRHKESSVDIQRVAASNCKSKNPSFQLTMTEHILNRTDVPIKPGFLKHFNRRAQIVTLQVGGKSWHIKACLYQHIKRRGAFSYGWRKFVKENSLQVGDKCIFELIEKDKRVLKVSIHKGHI